MCQSVTEIETSKNYNQSILIILSIFCVVFFFLFGLQWYKISENIKEYKVEKADQLNKLQKAKTNLIDISKLESSKKFIIIKTEDLETINGNINQLAEEIYSEKNKAATIIDKDIDRINLYMAIGIGFFAIIGIFVPLVINYLSHDDLKEKLKEIDKVTKKLHLKTKNLNSEELKEAVKNANEAISKSNLIDGIVEKTDKIIPRISTISLQIALSRVMNMTSTAIKNIRLNNDYSLFNELFIHLKEELKKCKDDDSHLIAQSETLKKTLSDFVQMFNDEKIRFVSIIDKKGLDLEFNNLIKGVNSLITSNTEEQENEFYTKISSTIDQILEIIKI